MLRFIVVTFAFLIPVLSFGAESTNPVQADYRYIGRIAGRLVQTGYFLEFLTTGSCKKYALRPHTASDDIELVRSHLSQHLPPEYQNESSIISDMASTVKDYAEREIGEISSTLTNNGATEELRCGYLLGIGSVTYYQALRDWEDFNKLEKSKWKQP